MNRDLRLYFLAIGLPAVLITAGGLYLLRLESVRARMAEREILREKADAVSLSLQARLRERVSGGRSIEQRILILTEMQAAENFVKDVFIWKKEEGVVWRLNPNPLMSYDWPPDFKWKCEGRKSRSLRRGWFRPEGDGATVIWARNGENMVCGLEADLRTEPSSADPRFLFTAAACFVALLFCVLVAGGILLLRAARRARHEALIKTTFVSNVSHELKTPLTNILLYTDLLREKRLKTEDKKKNALDIIGSECDRMLRMVTDLLDFSRLERGCRKYNTACFDLSAFARESAEPLKDRFAENGLTIDAPDPVFIMADRDGVRQIILNLLDNAAKYAAEGGPVVLSVRQSASGGTLSVSDRGPGLSPRALSHVFERFWRGNESITGTVGGSGIGLSIAHHLAVDMGGDLSVAPHEGGGCVFTLELTGGERHG